MGPTFYRAVLFLIAILTNIKAITSIGDQSNGLISNLISTKTSFELHLGYFLGLIIVIFLILL